MAVERARVKIIQNVTVLTRAYAHAKNTLRQVEMGSTKWNNKKGVQCAECGMWLDSNNRRKTPSHKPKGDILSIKDCVGSGKAPQADKGFDPGSYPYKDRER